MAFGNELIWYVSHLQEHVFYSGAMHHGQDRACPMFYYNVDWLVIALWPVVNISFLFKTITTIHTTILHRNEGGMELPWQRLLTAIGKVWRTIGTKHFVFCSGHNTTNDHSQQVSFDNNCCKLS